MAVSSSVLASYASTGNVTTSGGIVVGSTVSTGTVLLVAVAAGAASVVTGVSDSKGNTWTKVADVSTSTGAAATGALWSCVVGTALSSTDTVTATRTTTGGLAVVVHAVAGADTTTPVASYVTAAASTVSDPTASNVTVPTDGLGLCVVGFANNTTITPGTGWTAAGSAVSSGSGNPRQVATWTGAPGTLTPAGNLASNGGWTVIAAALSPAPAGNAAPIAAAGGARTVRVGVPVTFEGEATDSDGTIASWAWDFDDGGTATTQDATHTFATAGTYDVTLTVTDDDGATDSDTATVTVLTSPTLAIIGDSLTARTDGNTGDRESLTRSRLAAAGFDNGSIYWHGVGGKKFEAADAEGKTTAQNIADARTMLGVVDRWLIALGTNNTADGTTLYESRLRAVLDLIYTGGLTPECIVVGLSFYSPANTNAATYNPLMAAVVEDYPHARFADWNATIHAPHDDADWIYPTDSTHMTAQGYGKRDAFYISELQNERDGGTVGGSLVITGAATGRGAASAAGALTLTGAATARAAATAAGSLALTGTATARGAGVAAGVLTLVGTAAATTAGGRTAAGTIALTGTATARAAAQAAGTLVLVGAASVSSTGTATAHGTITLAGRATPGGIDLDDYPRLTFATLGPAGDPFTITMEG